MATNKEIINKLNHEILSITMIIQKEFPLHYAQLSETPLFPSATDEHIYISDLRKYLETIREQLETFRNTDSLREDEHSHHT